MMVLKRFIMLSSVALVPFLTGFMSSSLIYTHTKSCTSSECSINKLTFQWKDAENVDNCLIIVPGPQSSMQEIRQLVLENRGKDVFAEFSTNLALNEN